MATSKNKRKNGKTVKSNLTKRMRLQAGYDLKNLMICNVVDCQELEGELRMFPRSLVYDRKRKMPVNVTQLQEVAIKCESWKWEVHYGVICRNPDGTVYLDKEENFICKETYILTDLNEEITDRLMNAFQRANALHRLTMFWVASPIEQKNTPIEAVLAPVWHFDVLGNMLTQYEQETEGHRVIRYRTDKLMEFVWWFLDQNKYREELKLMRDVSFYFEPTGEPMKKGELQAYRERIKRAWEAEKLGAFSGLKFEPLATVQGFTKPKHSSNRWTIECNGYAMSVLMTALDTSPPCVNCVVDVRYADGRENTIKFLHNNTEFLGNE